MHCYLLILIDQEVIGAEFKNHQTSEQLKSVFAFIRLSCLVKVYGDLISTVDVASPLASRLGNMFGAQTAVDIFPWLSVGRRGGGDGGPESPAEK